METDESSGKEAWPGSAPLVHEDLLHELLQAVRGEGEHDMRGGGTLDTRHGHPVTFDADGKRINYFIYEDQNNIEAMSVEKTEIQGIIHCRL